MQTARYNSKPIGSVRSLARALHTPKRQLYFLAENSHRFFHANTPEMKPDGRVRQTYRVSPSLDSVHRRINEAIFSRTMYPTYLTGGIRDRQYPRDYVVDAGVHAGQPYIVQEDVRDFFPSVRAEQVRHLWRYFFGFSPDVAEILTKLTTNDGALVQGARTSSHIANLVFWRDEPDLVADLEKLGFIYTRHVDNITLSSNVAPPKSSRTNATSLIYAMLHRHGLRPNRVKRQAAARHECQEIHGLTVNSGVPKLLRRTRARIRAEIHEFAQEGSKLPPDVREQAFRSLLGKVSVVRRFHPHLADELENKLRSSPQ